MQKHKDDKRQMTGVDLGLSAEEKEELRKIAFQAIRCRCLGEVMPVIAVDSARLKEPGAAFVCIHKGKDLRGCIGMIEARMPLWETISTMAVQAAFEDPRFCALANDEIDSIDIEISVLTPIRRIAGPSEIEIGKHGLLVRKGCHSGLLLPQVAIEHGLDRDRFLDLTCRKAGLHEKAWTDKEVETYIFSADVF
ncbi:AMMECR1 domain protein [Syntrophobacter sp. SbD1]|nr:AMMECR1 domain protein [Syntrophobacter sp. SbD1]